MDIRGDKARLTDVWPELLWTEIKACQLPHSRPSCPSALGWVSSNTPQGNSYLKLEDLRCRPPSQTTTLNVHSGKLDTALECWLQRCFLFWEWGSISVRAQLTRSLRWKHTWSLICMHDTHTCIDARTLAVMASLKNAKQAPAVF